ncbi:MAG: rutB [Armatimonadetes bacterium]|jgi:nicotinamidase-related amidase|nr:rutB [Armatimonadota bacterium]
MPAKNKDLHGMVPDKADVALVLLDVINDMDFDGAELLLPHALAAAPRIAALRARAKAAELPVIYVNDNFGRWRSDFRSLIDHCLDDSVPGCELVRQLLPEEDDYFILKPKHSGFFSTTLDVLLSYLGVKTLIIAGFAGDICVLFTANDAYMRDFHLVVPCDCVASQDPDSNRRAVEQMRRVLKADVRSSTELDLATPQRDLRGRADRHPEG